MKKNKNIEAWQNVTGSYKKEHTNKTFLQQTMSLELNVHKWWECFGA